MVNIISVTFPNDSNELVPIPGAGVEADYIIQYSQRLEYYGYTHTLIPYSSSGPDPFAIGASILAATKKISIIIALRPNIGYPTYIAKALATLEHLGKGRVVVHIISGGSDADQAAEGDFLSKEERYERSEEYIKIFRKAWTASEPFDWTGKYYQFKQFKSNIRPKNPIPVSVGGSSDDAYRIGGSLADIFGLWGEPLKDTADQIKRIHEEAEKAGRPRHEYPAIWITLRPITSQTDELAWQKAHATLATIKANLPLTPRGPLTNDTPQNVGSQRLLDIAKRGDVQDRALWYPTVTATGARGASTAIVGSYDTVAESILEYVKLGCEFISIRGYDNLGDATDYGRFIIPRVLKGVEALKAADGATHVQSDKDGLEEAV